MNYHNLDGKTKPITQQTDRRRKSKLSYLFSSKNTVKPITKQDIEYGSDPMISFYYKYGIIFAGTPARSCMNSIL